MEKYRTGDLIDTGEYIIGEKYKVVNYLLNGIYQQIADYNNEAFKEKSDDIIENLTDNMKQTAKLLNEEDFVNADENDIIKVDYSSDYYGMVVSIYEKKD